MHALRLLLPLSLALLIGAGARLSRTPVSAQPASATYTRGKLSVTIPYHATREGSGKLTVEILDPEDHTLGRSQRTVETVKGAGAWQQAVTPDTPVAFEDMVWQRIRYRYAYDDDKACAIEGIESISRILRRPVVHILGQTTYLAGSAAAVRVIVSDAHSNEAVESGTVRIELLTPGRKSSVLFAGRLNRRGTVEAQFRLPAGLQGAAGPAKYEMRYVADTPIGSTEYIEPIQIEDKAAILLATEKPIYQPGQTIHVRALALDRADHKADADRALTFEIEDSRGNKVFKSSTATDRFGIASAEFPLADEVNLGAYHLRAFIGDAGSTSNAAEIAFNVERYVLPKFKVAVDFDEKDNKPRRDFRPGDHVTGTVRANYFFGKPVDHAEIGVKASSMDVEVFEAASVNGETDADGAYRFDLQLPQYFAGRPLSQGAARALIEATVKDSATHSETRGEPITISESPLLITAVPEGGTLIPHLENQVFVLSSYPDGSPAKADLTIHFPGAREQQVTTDSGGIATIRLNPEAGIESIRIDADDHRGNRCSSNAPLQTRWGADQIMLRTNRTLLKAGDALHLNVFSTRPRGAVYVDVVKNGQTMLTRDLDLTNGQAELTLTATPQMAGTLDIDAYLFGHDAQPMADHRLVFIQPADELSIQTTADAAVYEPGSEARVRFHVTNSHGEGVSAAIGVQVVDDAVFALAEKQPGFAKVFFYLEQEVMKPRYEIHSLSMPDVLEPSDISRNGQQDRAARVLFSATELATPNKLDTEVGRSLPQERYAEYRQRYRAAFMDEVRRVAARLSGRIRNGSGDGEAVEEFRDAFKNVVLDDGSRPHDSWNAPLRIESTGGTRGRGYFYRVRSAGPDGRFYTADDFIGYIEDRSGIVRDQPGRGGSIDVRIEKMVASANQHMKPVPPEITGRVADPSGAVIPNALITLHELANHQVRTTVSGNGGQFGFAALPSGDYWIELSSQGFESVSGDFTLRASDRAVLSVNLAVGSATDTVMVTGMAEQLRPVGLVSKLNAMPAPMADAAIRGQSAAVYRKAGSPAAPPAEPHVRSYFPEALYINPEIITDAAGDASISIPIADSITTWRMAMLASTQSGALGTGASSIKVFQDFFADLDLPVTLTQGDRVSVPIGIYNYSGSAGRVSLTVQPEDWFSLDDDTASKTVAVESGRVGASQFTISARRIGKFKLTLRARMLAGGQTREDIVVREIEVIPNGREQNLVFNGRLETSVQQDLLFPATSIPDATSILVRVYPGPLSQVVEGMDSILSMPNGCFEQTSSSTYPNVLALDYMKRTKKLTPEVHAKAEGYILNGYQRLLTFEVPGGGFSWFGQAPANKILTAYGLMEFNDMSKVSEVDSRLIERTRDWLARQQQPDGSWVPDKSFINEGATNRYNSDVLRITAYIAWALANTGYQGSAVERAKQFIESHASAKADDYTLAIIANFAADYGKDRGFTRQSMQALVDAREEKDDLAWWSTEETGVYSTGASAAVETTGLATQALLKWGQASEVARKALEYISSKKQAGGNWGTTQATIMALRSLLLASELSAADVHGSLQVMVNGNPVETLKLTDANNDLFHQFVFKDIDAQKPASIQLAFAGTGGLAYQVVGRYFTPWDERSSGEPLSIEIAYDRTKLARNDIATATATIRNNLSKTANMVMADLGIPPGFDLLSEDLQAFRDKGGRAETGRLEKYSLTATQAILYFNALAPGQTVRLQFRLRAKYPIRARSFESRVYEYYDPEVKAIARPVGLEVDER
jgi:hypothetical protein